MKKIDFKVAGKTYSHTLPENWEETSPEQFLRMAAHAAQGDTASVAMALLQPEPEVMAALKPADWWALSREVEWATDLDALTRQPLDTVALPGGTVLIGWSGDFGGVTWEEFIFADTYAERHRWDVVLAALWRPANPDWDGESDQRIPFSTYGTERRLELTKDLPREWLDAVEVAYLTLRKHLTDRFPRLFNTKEEIGEEQPPEPGRPRRKPKPGWMEVTRNLMADNFYEERKYMQLPAASVLFQLHRMIEQSRRRK